MNRTLLQWTVLHHFIYWTGQINLELHGPVYVNAVFYLLLIGCSWAEEEVHVEKSFDDDTGRWKSSPVEAPGDGVRTSLLGPPELVLWVCG